MLIAQISDAHLDLTPGKRFDPPAQLDRAVARLKALPRQPDLLIVSGDCANNGTVAEYEAFNAALSLLQMPKYVVPGNHDDRTVMRQMFGEQGEQHHPHFMQYVVSLEGIRLIALDTLVTGHGFGRLCQERLSWLEERLAEDMTTPTILFQHHPPYSIGISTLDESAFEGAEQLGQIISRYDNIECLLSGHVHGHTMRRYQGTLAMTCSATGFQVYPDLSETETISAVSTAGSALLHYWSEETRLITHTLPFSGQEPPEYVFDGTNWLT